MRLSRSAEAPGATQVAQGAPSCLLGTGRGDTGSTGNLRPSGVTDGVQVGDARVPGGVTSAALRGAPELIGAWDVWHVASPPEPAHVYFRQLPLRASVSPVVLGDHVALLSLVRLSLQAELALALLGLLAPAVSSLGLNCPQAPIPSRPPLTMCLLSKYSSCSFGFQLPALCLSQQD